MWCSNKPKTTIFITSQLNRSWIRSQCLKLKISLNSGMTSTKFLYYVQNKSFSLKTNSFLILVISTSLKIVNSPLISVSTMEEKAKESIKHPKFYNIKWATKGYWVDWSLILMSRTKSHIYVQQS